MSKSFPLFTLMISLLLTLIINYFYVNYITEDLRDEINSRPPVIVFDMARLALDSVPVGSSTTAINDHFQTVQDTINKFSNAGFLVLSREHIITAPDELLVSTEDIYPYYKMDSNGGLSNE